MADEIKVDQQGNRYLVRDGVTIERLGPQVDVRESIGKGIIENTLRAPLSAISGTLGGLNVITGGAVPEFSQARQDIEKQTEQLFDTPFFRGARETNPTISALSDPLQVIVPAGRTSQAIVGGLQGLAQGEGAIEKLVGLITGATAGFIGGTTGRRLQGNISSAVQRQFPSDAIRNRALAAKRLLDDGFVLEEQDLAFEAGSGRMARARGRQRQNIQGGPAPAQRQKTLRLNEKMSAPAGMETNNLGDNFLNFVDDKTDELYSTVRSGVPDPVPAEQFQEGIARVSEKLANQGTDSAKLTGQMQRVADTINANQMDGAQYLDWRTRMGSAARAADFEDANIYYDMIGELDDVFGAQPGVGDTVREAGKSWRLGEIYRKSVSPQGNVNATTMVRNIDRFFSTAKRGRGDADIQAMRQTLRDVQQFPGFVTSFTPEGTTGFGIMKRIGLDLLSSTGERAGGAGARNAALSAVPLFGTAFDAGAELGERIQGVLTNAMEDISGATSADAAIRRLRNQ